jgi:hypothetical protein
LTKAYEISLSNIEKPKSKRKKGGEDGGALMQSQLFRKGT